MQSNRFLSLDTFRGATVALMILVNNPGSWGAIYPPLKHAAWHGLTPTDLVFPFFLFAVGNAMAFVIPRLEAAGPAVFWKKILKRSILIFLIGIFLNWFPFVKYDAAGGLEWKSFTNLRFLGVLQRIALCYFFAAVIIHYCKVRGSFVIAAILLLGYWLLCIAGNPSDPYSLKGWFGTAIDSQVLGGSHMYHGEGIPFEPEGLLSTIPAISQVIFGYLAGNYIITKGKTFEMLAVLLITGCILIFTGFVWDMQFPINKKIWTSSYVIYTTGLALMVLSVLMYLMEFKNIQGAWSRFFDVFGKNALFIFALSGILPRLLALLRIPAPSQTDKPRFVSPLGWFYENICKPLFDDPRNGSLLYAICFITFMWLMAWMLDRKKIYIKV